MLSITVFGLQQARVAIDVVLAELVVDKPWDEGVGGHDKGAVQLDGLDIHVGRVHEAYSI